MAFLNNGNFKILFFSNRTFNSGNLEFRKCLRVRNVISKIGNGDGTFTVRGGKRKIYCISNANFSI